MSVTAFIGGAMKSVIDAGSGLPIVRNVKNLLPTELAKAAIDVASKPVAYLENAAVDNAGFYSRRWMRTACDGVIERTSEVVETGDIRSVFRDLADVTFPTWNSHHTHPDAAAYRSEVQAFAVQLAAKTGFQPWMNSMSNSDRRNGFQGKSSFYMTKDLTHDTQNDEITPNHIVMLHDDDYYMEDLEMFLARRFPSPVLLTTFNPQDVAGTVPDGSYVITENDEVVETFSPNTTYKHRLWDWVRGDHVVARGWIQSVVYLKEMRVHPLDNTRLIVLLVPVRVMPTLSLSLVGGDVVPMTRRRFNENGFVVNRFTVRVGKKIVPTVSFARPGDTMCATMPVEVLRTVYDRWQRVSVMQMSTVATHLERAYRERDPEENLYFEKHQTIPAMITVMVQVFEFGPEIISKSCAGSPIGLPVTANVADRQTMQVFTPLPNTNSVILEELKPVMRDILKPDEDPWATSQLYPRRGPLADQSAVTGRVTRYNNTVKPPAAYNRYSREFINFMVGAKRHTLVPYESELILETQNTPSQRQQLARGDINGSNSSQMIKSFVKAECYPKATDCRMISTVSEAHKLDWSVFTHALSAGIFKDNDRYAFVDPVRLGKRVNRVCLMARRLGMDICETDYSCFDGHHSEWFYSQEEALVVASFHPAYHETIRRLVKAERGQRGITRYGVEYNTGETRLSGSPGTSVMNTFDNLLMQYLMLREAGYEAEVAYEMVGLAGGDDGLMLGLKKSLVEQTCRKVGFKITVNYTGCGFPVKMLARYWVTAWEAGGIHSMIDVVRQMSKLHLTASVIEISREEVLARKAMNLCQSDGSTPFLGRWARKVIGQVGTPGEFAKNQAKPGDGPVESVSRRDGNADANYWSVMYPGEVFPQLSEEENWEFFAMVEPELVEMVQCADSQLSEVDDYLFPAEVIVHRDAPIRARVILGDTIMEPDQTGQPAVAKAEPVVPQQVQRPERANEQRGATVRGGGHRGQPTRPVQPTSGPKRNGFTNGSGPGTSLSVRQEASQPRRARSADPVDNHKLVVPESRGKGAAFNATGGVGTAGQQPVPQGIAKHRTNRGPGQPSAGVQERPKQVEQPPPAPVSGGIGAAASQQKKKKSKSKKAERKTSQNRERKTSEPKPVEGAGAKEPRMKVETPAIPAPLSSESKPESSMTGGGVTPVQELPVPRAVEAEGLL